MKTMTEAEWLASTRQDLMMNFLRGRLSRDALQRKQRLFICACCREVWSFMINVSCRNAVEVAERYADGQATHLERNVILKGVHVTPWQRATSAASTELLVANAAVYAGVGAKKLEDALNAVVSTVVRVRLKAALGPFFDPAVTDEVQTVRLAEKQKLCDRFRDIFGNPFRPVTLDRSWLASREGTVVKMAQAIYDERHFADLPILADALEDAGCDNSDILSHCRQTGEHVRGCWVIDLLLGKE
jgi:hypothetical protein